MEPSFLTPDNLMKITVLVAFTSLIFSFPIIWPKNFSRLWSRFKQPNGWIRHDCYLVLLTSLYAYIQVFWWWIAPLNFRHYSLLTETVWVACIALGLMIPKDNRSDK